MAGFSGTASLAGLPATRRAILVGLKTRGEARAEELAGDLRITASAVRQHLSGLVANGFVGHREVKGGPGRPKHLYSLTAAAEALFPKRYSDLTNEVLAIVEDEDPALLDKVFERRRDARVINAMPRLVAAGPGLAGRVAELATILDEDGYLARWEQLADGTFRVTEHNCAVLGVAQRYGQACSSEIEFLRTVLPDAVVERTQHILAGAHRCAYLIIPSRLDQLVTSPPR
ncbi:MAG TPA: metalloregulator ArsR/SmtB family transcription factor [Acidimicrobiales bacterium]|nr:metalloregulator ArsR/SmtB family transcription factor [Acidimicrobiales bacterium]